MINNYYSLNLSEKSLSSITEFGAKNSLQVQLSNKEDLKEFLDILIIESLKNNATIQLICTDEIAAKIEHDLQELGYAHLVSKSQDGHPAISSKINALFNIQSKKWDDTLNSVLHQYKNASSQTLAHIASLDLRVLPPVSLQSLIQTYNLRVQRKSINYSLDLNLDSSNYEIDKKEYLYLRERIEKASSLFMPSFVNNPIYDQFNSVLFDMLTAEESYHLVLDQLRKGIQQLNLNKKQLESYILTYKDHLYNLYHEQIDHFIHEYNNIKTECQIINISDSSSSSIGHKILSKLKSNNQNNNLKKQLVHRYIQLTEKWKKSIFNKSIELTSISDWNQLNELFENIDLDLNSWGKHIQHQIAGQITRLTYNNSLLDFNLQENIGLIKEEIGQTFDEVNQNSIFNSTLENNTLYIKDTIQFLTKTISNWTSVLDNLDMLMGYHPWRKFWDDEEIKVKKLCTVLFSSTKENWIWEFENWFFRLLIEKNMNSKLRNNHDHSKILMQINERHSNIQKAMLQTKLSSHTKEAIIKTKGLISELTKWRPQTQDMPISSSSSLHEIRSCLPIKITNSDQPTLSSNAIKFEYLDNGYLISNTSLEVQLTKNINLDIHQTVKFEPKTDKSIIQSTHSHRWEQIKEISRYLSMYNTSIGFHENKDIFILSCFNNKINTNNIKLKYGQNTTAIWLDDHSDFVVKLTESLLDNKRKMCFETMDGSLFSTDTVSGLLMQYKLIEFLTYIGLTELSNWSKDIKLWGQNNPKINVISSIKTTPLSKKSTV